MCTVYHSAGKRMSVTRVNMRYVRKLLELSVLNAREIQIKILNIFHLIIYWIQKVHNDFIFLRSLQCVQYKCSSVSEVHGCLYKKNSFGWERRHSCTACWTSSSDLKDLPPIACLSGPTYMKITVGEVWRVWRMWKTLEGQILDCCNSWTGSMGPSIVMLQQNTCTQTSTSFGLHCRTQMIL